MFICSRIHSKIVFSSFYYCPDNSSICNQKRKMTLSSFHTSLLMQAKVNLESSCMHFLRIVFSFSFLSWILQGSLGVLFWFSDTLAQKWIGPNIKITFKYIVLTEACRYISVLPAFAFLPFFVFVREGFPTFLLVWKNVFGVGKICILDINVL